MLVGTASLDRLAEGAASIDEFGPDGVELQGVTCLQLTAEMHNGAREAVLPASLHPTVPAVLSVQVWDVRDGPWGSFAMALVRIGCRSGVRARGFTRRVVASTGAAVDGLRSVFGFPACAGDVELQHDYGGARARVAIGGELILGIVGLDPEPMGVGDVQYTGMLNLAQTPKGLRLVQVEAHHDAQRVERLTARLDSFDAMGWGEPLLDPYRVVSCSVAVEDVSLPAVRFVCKPDELAFTGTEAVA